jgi:hypothetical protein
MASRSEAGRGPDGREKPGGQRMARSIFIAATLLTAAWVVALILLARWLIEAIF